MTGLLVAGGILVLMLIVGGAALFLLLPLLLAGLGILVLLAVLAVGAVLLLPNFITLDQFKPQILEMLQKATGREIAIGGPIGFSVWPVLGIELNDISIGNPKGYDQPIMLSARELGVGVTLSSLINHKLELEKLTLSGAQINLIAKSNGSGNWHIGTDKKPQEAPAEPAPETTVKTESHTSEFSIKDINITKVAIADTDITIERAGRPALEIQDLALDFTMPSLDKPADLNASLTYLQRKLALTAQLAEPGAYFRSQQASPLTLRLTSGGDKLTFEGTLEQGKAAGSLTSKVADLGALASWAAHAPVSVPFKALSLTSQVSSSATGVALKEMQLQLDKLQVSGNLAVAMAATRPKITADIAIPMLNIDELKGMTAAKESAGSGNSSATASAASLKGLNAMDASVNAKVGGLVVQKMVLGATTINLSLKGGKLDSTFTPASFFDGKISGRATANAATNSFTTTLELADIAVEPLLTTLSGKSKLTGKGNVTLAISAPVANPLAGLDGSGSFNLQDGAIKGVNIPALIRKAKAALGQGQGGEDGPQQTDFSELTGTFTLDNGTASNNDLRLLSPLVRVAGKGSANLLAKTADYRVDTSLVADLTGQGGVMERKGLIIPIRVSGPFSNLSYTPDLQGLVLGNLENAGAIGDTLKQLKGGDAKQAVTDAAKGAVGNLLGLPKPQPAQDGAEPAPQALPKAEDLLNNFLKAQ